MDHLKPRILSVALKSRARAAPTTSLVQNALGGGGAALVSSLLAVARFLHLRLSGARVNPQDTRTALLPE